MKLSTKLTKTSYINKSGRDRLYDKGSVIVLLALMMTVLLGSCALVFDVGMAYVQKAKLQNAIDASVLAGAQELPDTTSALNVANQYISLNGYSLTGTLNATAAATVSTVGGVSGAVPLGVEKQSFVYGQTYTLKNGGGSGNTGNYGALALGGTGASVFENNLEDGYSGTLTVGQSVDTNLAIKKGQQILAQAIALIKTQQPRLALFKKGLHALWLCR